MSANYYLITENKELDLGQESVLGQALSDAMESLDTLADDLNLTPISAFVSFQQNERQDYLEEAEDTDFNDLTTDEGFRETQPEEYYEPDEALENIQALLQNYAKTEDMDENVMDDLRSLNDALKRCLENNSRFYISVTE
ncbi:MAG: hypothetical protein H7095_08250 [Pseudopedobacter sp.]|nr:hypothetical protein [Deinococcales bacterium]